MAIPSDEPITDEYIYNFLESHPLGILSTVNENGLPDAAPMYFIITRTFELFFITPRGSQKYRNMLTKPEVILTVTEPSTSESVSVRGTVSEVADKLDAILQQLAEKLNYGVDFLEALPVLAYKDSEKTVIKISPSLIGMRRYTKHAFVEGKVTLPGHRHNIFTAKRKGVV